MRGRGFNTFENVVPTKMTPPVNPVNSPADGPGGFTDSKFQTHTEVDIM